MSSAVLPSVEVRRRNDFCTLGQEVQIEKEMSERMGRILYLFERKGIVRNIIIGVFCTNDVATVARIWAHLLLFPETRFKDSFDRIIFATGEKTFAAFHSAFHAWGQLRATGLRRTRSSSRSSDMASSSGHQQPRPSAWLEMAHGPGLDRLEQLERLNFSRGSSLALRS